MISILLFGLTLCVTLVLITFTSFLQFLIVEEKTSEQVARSSSAPSPFGVYSRYTF